MPELPEVETVRRTLLPHVVDRVVERVAVRERRLRRPVPADIAARLTGRRITALRRLGKYLLFDLDDGHVLLVHLGMSGSLAATGGGGKHDHVEIELRGGTRLVYNDPRRFGLVDVVDDAPAEVAELGVDPLSSEFTVAYLAGICRGRSRPIKNVLMDQAFIAGLGNIYASEILFRAAVRPTRRARTLRRREVEAIRDATGTVLADAIRAGGSSISDYRDGDGKPGYFQLQAAVYDREGKECRRCGALVRTRVLSGRSTFYCPGCQK